MDIENLYTLDLHEAGAEMQVKDESGKPLEMYISIVGVDSKAWKKASSELRRAVFAGGDSEDERIKTIVSCTIGWRGFESKGKELEFTEENIKGLYVNAPYILDQIDVFVGDRANFTKGKEAS